VGVCSSFRSVGKHCSILLTASLLIDPFALISLRAWCQFPFPVLLFFYVLSLRYGIIIIVRVRVTPEDDRDDVREDEDDGGGLHVGTEESVEDIVGEV
jgi:hypothetical protein